MPFDRIELFYFDDIFRRVVLRVSAFKPYTDVACGLLASAHDTTFKINFNMLNIFL